MSGSNSGVKAATGLAGQAVAALRAQVRGELVQPGDAQYDAARMVYNAMIDKRPALIVRCVDVADVIHAVNFGRDHRLVEDQSLWSRFERTLSQPQGKGERRHC